MNPEAWRKIKKPASPRPSKGRETLLPRRLQVVRQDWARDLRVFGRVPSESPLPGGPSPTGLGELPGRGSAGRRPDEARGVKNQTCGEDLGGNSPKNSRIEPMNHPTHDSVQTLGAFLPLRVGGVRGADGERAGVRCAPHHLRVPGEGGGHPNLWWDGRHSMNPRRNIQPARPLRS
jgi:hypothetical protein